MQNHKKKTRTSQLKSIKPIYQSATLKNLQLTAKKDRFVYWKTEIRTRSTLDPQNNQQKIQTISTQTSRNIEKWIKRKIPWDHPLSSAGADSRHRGTQRTSETERAAQRPWLERRQRRGRHRRPEKRRPWWQRMIAMYLASPLTDREINAWESTRNVCILYIRKNWKTLTPVEISVGQTAEDLAFHLKSEFRNCKGFWAPSLSLSLFYEICRENELLDNLGKGSG